MTETATELTATLRSGLAWLYNTEQPEGTILQHHGVSLPVVANRRYRFVPTGYANLPVVVVDVAQIEYADRIDWVVTNPLAPGELDELAAEIRALGFDVALTWNGHPGTTGSIALKRPAHPSLIAAVDLYHAGCPEHPRRHVFCECGWYRTGNALLVKPTT